MKPTLAKNVVPAPDDVQWAAKRQRLRALLRITSKLDRALARDYKNPDAAAVIVIQRLGMLGADLCAGVVRTTPKRVYFGSLSEGDQFYCDDALVLKTIKFHLQGKKWQQSLFGTSRADAAAYLRRHAGPGFKLKDLRIGFATGYAMTLMDGLTAPGAKLGRKSVGPTTDGVDFKAIRTALRSVLDAEEPIPDVKLGADGLAVVDPEPTDPEDAW